MEADAHAILCNQQDILGIVCSLHLDKLVILPKTDRSKPCLADIGIVSDWCLLHNTILRSHKQVFAVPVFLDGDQSRYLLAWHKLQ